MGTTLKFTGVLEHIHEGVARVLGLDLRRFPVEKSTTADGRRLPGLELVIEPNAEVKVWDGTLEGAIRDFAVLGFQIVGEGTLDLAFHIDTPVSESNLAASGSNPKYVPQPRLSCLVPRIYDHDRCLLNPTNNTMLGIDGDGKPNVLTSGSTVEGKIYGAWLANRGTTDVRVVFFIAE